MNLGMRSICEMIHTNASGGQEQVIFFAVPD
jgi:hypothetical protein